MTAAKIALLEDRGVISVTGEDACKFLQGLITNDMDLLKTQGAIFAALLSPQGKILFDFFVVRHGDGYLLDVAKDQVSALIQRLSMYKLRAKVEITDVTTSTRVAASWGLDRLCSENSENFIAVADPRNESLSHRVLTNAPRLKSLLEVLKKTPDDWALVPGSEFDARRIDKGIPEGGRDYAWGEVFPHEANFDHLNGVSFTKGCYVGQEIVARMEHRGTARRRIIRVTGSAPLPPTGTAIFAGDVVIGQMGSSHDTAGLAVLRLDRVAEFAAKNVPLIANGVPVLADQSDLARLMPQSQGALDPK